MPVSPRISTVESVGGHLGDQPADLLHRLRLADQVGRALDPFEPLLHRPVLVRQLAFLGHAAQQRFEIDQLARLGEIVESPVAQRGHRRFERRLAGQHDGLGVGRKLLRPGDHLDAVAAGHVEIDQDAVVGVAIERGQGGGSVGADGRLVAHPRQLDAHQLLQRFLVVGEQQLQSIMRLGGDRRAPSARVRHSGKRTRKVEPRPGPSLAASMSPPRSAMMR